MRPRLGLPRQWPRVNGAEAREVAPVEVVTGGGMGVAARYTRP
ncbi:MAG: hypothetical protein ABI880_07935 [Acidobacteriota bacterium]